MKAILSFNKFCLRIFLFTVVSGILYSCAPTAGIKVVSYPSEKISTDYLLVAMKLKVTDIRKDYVNDILRVQITALNKTTNDLQFEYRFRWIDSKGFEVRTGLSTWNSVYSVAKDTINMSGVAPNKDVTDYEFIVRFPDRWGK